MHPRSPSVSSSSRRRRVSQRHRNDSSSSFVNNSAFSSRNKLLMSSESSMPLASSTPSLSVSSSTNVAVGPRRGVVPSPFSSPRMLTSASTPSRTPTPAPPRVVSSMPSSSNRSGGDLEHEESCDPRGSSEEPQQSETKTRGHRQRVRHRHVSDSRSTRAAVSEQIAWYFSPVHLARSDHMRQLVATAVAQGHEGVELKHFLRFPAIRGLGIRSMGQLRSVLPSSWIVEGGTRVFPDTVLSFVNLDNNHSNPGVSTESTESTAPLSKSLSSKRIDSMHRSHRTLYVRGDIDCIDPRRLQIFLEECVASNIASDAVQNAGLDQADSCQSLRESLESDVNRKSTTIRDVIRLRRRILFVRVLRGDRANPADQRHMKEFTIECDTESTLEQVKSILMSLYSDLNLELCTLSEHQSALRRRSEFRDAVWKSVVSELPNSLSESSTTSNQTASLYSTRSEESEMGPLVQLADVSSEKTLHSFPPPDWSPPSSINPSVSSIPIGAFRGRLLCIDSVPCSVTIQDVENALIEALPMDVVESISSIPASRDHKSRKAYSRSQEKTSSLRTFQKGCQWIEFIDMDPQSISHRQRSLLAQLSMNCTAADRGMDAFDSSLQESEEPRNSFSCVVRVTSPLFVQILCERCNGFLMIRFRISSPSEENSASGQDCLAHCPIRSIPGDESAMYEFAVRELANRRRKRRRTRGSGRGHSADKTEERLSVTPSKIIQSRHAVLSSCLASSRSVAQSMMKRKNLKRSRSQLHTRQLSTHDCSPAESMPPVHPSTTPFSLDSNRQTSTSRFRSDHPSPAKHPSISDAQVTGYRLLPAPVPPPPPPPPPPPLPPPLQPPYQPFMSASRVRILPRSTMEPVSRAISSSPSTSRSQESFPLMPFSRSLPPFPSNRAAVGGFSTVDRSSPDRKRRKVSTSSTSDQPPPWIRGSSSQSRSSNLQRLSRNRNSSSSLSHQVRHSRPLHRGDHIVSSSWKKSSRMYSSSQNRMDDKSPISYYPIQNQLEPSNIDLADDPSRNLSPISVFSYGPPPPISPISDSSKGTNASSRAFDDLYEESHFLYNTIHGIDHAGTQSSPSIVRRKSSSHRRPSEVESDFGSEKGQHSNRRRSRRRNDDPSLFEARSISPLSSISVTSYGRPPSVSPGALSSLSTPSVYYSGIATPDPNSWSDNADYIV